FTQKTNITLGHYIFIFKPGIEQIANKVNGCSRWCNTIEPTAQTLLAPEAGRAVGYAEMEIGREIDFFTFRELHETGKYSTNGKIPALRSLTAANS
ncbi:MAG: hypothetical protein EBZ77_08450, partial [Chitinophagia bacterium]|nr:hypothetical protein [Chitinophagia bacterium]